MPNPSILASIGDPAAAIPPVIVSNLPVTVPTDDDDDDDGYEDTPIYAPRDDDEARRRALADLAEMAPRITTD